ncbi:hypothetical protein [Georgenia sp. H159]|nr:hypothetical protein [Georgenia sp. H159]
MSTQPDETPHEPLPAHHDDPVLLEEDETVPPRPEEEIADQLRAEPS